MKSLSMKSVIGFTICMAISLAAYNQTPKMDNQTNQSANPDGIFPKGQMIDREHFSSGTAWVYWIMQADSVYNTQLASVTYEPGTRTKWHYHPAGQILIITSGTAYYQEKGKPRQILSKGDVAKCPPGVPHWHGSAPGNSMTALAINPNMQKGGVVWQSSVTDEEYGK